MRIRWNTTNAEMERGVHFEPALAHWNSELPCSLTGKKKAAAERKAKQQYLSPCDFQDLKKITNVIEVLHGATLNLSKKSVPIICKILTLYKVVKDHLEEHRATILPVDDTCNLRKAIKAGIAKLQIHIDKALISDYLLIGAVLHPAIRLLYFQSNWSKELADCAKIVLEHLYEVYKEELDEETPAAPKITTSSKPTSPSKGIWCRAIATASISTVKKSQTELEVYFSGIYPITTEYDEVLPWWKVSPKGASDYARF
ncbi:hypothetical protein C8R45DRAFT_837649 [Mycena sanguinolenta]|nr:hypothetical protein C8R45DRAFT_837649 [Mycena sanguinolenta]